MKIKELILHNFGVYAGSNSFTFKGRKPIVLIGGMNGRGKTTFLDAVLIALYGSNSFAYKESRFKSYGQYLKSYVNQSDGTLNTFVSLELVVGPGNKEKYKIIRSWDGTKKRVVEQIQVWKNGKADDFLTHNWPLFVESLMPSGLSSFFFFDGEKIASLAVEDTSEQMKDSIKTLLGISVIHSLQNDLSRVVNRAKKQQADSAETITIEQLREERDRLAAELNNAEEELNALRAERDRSVHKLETIRQEYSAKGGDIYAQRQHLYTKRTALASRIDSLQERLISDAASELPLSLVQPLLQRIQDKAILEHEQILMGSTIIRLESLFRQYHVENQSERKIISNFLDYVRDSAEPQLDYLFDNISDTSLSKLQVLLNDQLETNRVDIRRRMAELSELKQQKDELDNYLSVEIDEKAISDLYRHIKEYEQRIIALDVTIKVKEEEIQTINSRATLASRSFKRTLESYIDRIESNEVNDRVLKYAHMASVILEEYTIRLQQKKVSAVAETMTRCYKLLANKTTLIDRIEMNPVSLDLRYVNYDGAEVSRNSLSAGEKQLMVISLLWALAICSRKKLPVIIDTPLSRLDSAHRSSVIQTYFPHASDQTIILSTDTEIDDTYYQLMKPNIGDEFTLIYDDETRSTTISRGYFQENTDDS